MGRGGYDTTGIKPPGLSSHWLSINWIEILGELSAAYAVFKFYEGQTTTPTGLPDKQVVHINLSLVYRMLQMAGIIHCPWSQPAEHTTFVEYFLQYQDGEMDPEAIVESHTATRGLRGSVLRRADVVVSMHNLRDQCQSSTTQHLTRTATPPMLNLGNNSCAGLPTP
ncbi:hypothetical protein OAory_01078370 [Aspergillus oryzae]|uniref:Uncharacterized protein n=2 Tax=Aspergillus oryzae TaxID=5062 RepID=A0A1S9DQP6_ASPOZ|nr:hypothetical protein OAory_01078370 [Aspergillus oryzae]QMW43133.1 hypothetical protein G4B11_006503 [Aspergillus flavus]